MTNALAAGTIVAVMAAAIGWFMTLRKQTFVGHTLAVISFPGAAAATLAGLPALAGYFTFSTLARSPSVKPEAAASAAAATGTR